MGLLRAVLAGGLLALLASGDTLVLQDGKQYQGVFVSGTAARIRFRTRGRAVQTFPTRDVARIEFRTQVADDGIPARTPQPAAPVGGSGEAAPPAAVDSETVPAPQPKAAETREPPPVATSLSALTDMNRPTPLDDSGEVDSVYTSMGKVLGLPVAGERSTADGRAAVRQFANGFIYLTVQGGAHAIYGPILEAWVKSGGEHSRLGYPASDEEDSNGGYSRYQRFEHGSISWNPRDPPRIEMNP
jgi:hypothetical protein